VPGRFSQILAPDTETFFLLEQEEDLRCVKRD